MTLKELLENRKRARARITQLQEKNSHAPTNSSNAPIINEEALPTAHPIEETVQPTRAKKRGRKQEVPAVETFGEEVEAPANIGHLVVEEDGESEEVEESIE